MTQPNTCPRCGAPVPAQSPGGICARCLLAAGLQPASQSQIPNSASGHPAPAGATSNTASFVPPAVADLASLFPQLEILELLGCGGMGAVYKARQIRLDRLVALKIIRPDAARDRSFAERFDREAKTLARLSHQYIVTVHEFGEVLFTDAAHSAGQPLYYFLMEYVDGSNLRQLIASRSLAPAAALAIVPQICEALQFAHDEGVVHRDIKPENILIDKRGRVKVADFGLAKLVAPSPRDVTITATRQVMGTPRYMAPEQMEGSHQVDHRADIYSLGVVFYEMLTGEIPAGHFEPPSRKAQVDARLDQVVLRSMAQEPDRRYQHASDVKTDVERISENPSPVPPRTPPTTTRQQRDGLGGPTLAATAVAGAALSAIGIVIGLFALHGVLNDPPPLDEIIILLIAIAALCGLCGTVLAAVAISRIGRAPGRLGGMGLAYLSAVSPPMAASNAAVFFVIQAIVESLPWHWHRDPTAISIAIAAGVCLPLNVWIGRRGWKLLVGEMSPSTADAPATGEGSTGLAQAPPFGYGFALAALCGMGWLITAALRNVGVAGLALGIGLQAILMWAVVQWKLKYVPSLRAEISAQPRLERAVMLTAALALFVLGMLAIERFQTALLDYHYFCRVGTPPGAVSLLAASNELADLRMATDLAAELDAATRLHRPDSQRRLAELLVLGVASGILLVAAAAFALGTRRFQYRWSLHLRPTVHVVALLAGTLPVVIGGQVWMDQKSGWGATRPALFRSGITVEQFADQLEHWAAANGYRRHLNIYGSQGGVHFASYQLAPDSSLDRWQYTGRAIWRPRPPMSVTCLDHEGDERGSRRVLVELPWTGIGSPEETHWPPIVEALQEALGPS